MDANGHENNALQTSPMMLMILRRHDIMIAKYQDGLRLLGGFHPLRGGGNNVMRELEIHKS